MLAWQYGDAPGWRLGIDIKLGTGRAPTAYDIAPMTPTLFISVLRDGSTSREYTSLIVEDIEVAELFNAK